MGKGAPAAGVAPAVASWSNGCAARCEAAPLRAAVRYCPMVTPLDWRDARTSSGPSTATMKQRRASVAIVSTSVKPVRRIQRTTRTRPALDMVTWRFDGPALSVTVRGRVATPVGDTVTLASEKERESIWNSVSGPNAQRL